MKKVFKTMAFTLLGLVLSVNLMAETKTYDITFDSSNNGSNDVHWTGSSVTSLTHDNVTWSTSVTGTTSFTASTTQCQIGSKNNPATQVTISTTAFAGKKITKASLTGFCMSNTGPTLTVTAGTTTIINAYALVKTTSTEYKTADNFSGVTLGSSDALTFTFNSSAKAAIVISRIEVTYEEGDDPSGPTLESIYFTNDAATKLSYTEGDVFDPAGLVVMGKYSEGDDKDVTEDVEWSFSPETLATTTTSVIVTASIDDVEDASKTVNGITVASAPKFTKVTANKTDWSGEYLLVYEKDGTAYVWTGVDASNSYATATITSNQIAKPATAAKLIIASMTGGYSIQVSGGDNDGKYVDQTKYDNGMSISDSPSANTLSHDGTNTVIAGSGASGDSHVTMRYNNTSGQDRFRYYKSGQQAIQLYEKVLDPISSAVTFAAPEGGSLVIKNGATPIATGATIQDGTVLDVEFGMTPAEAYKDVAIKVTNTTTSADVTSTVYNSETQKITMPRYAITVAVTFTKLYKISLVTAGEGTGSATMNGVTTDIYVDGDTQIDLVANAVAPNEFTKWSATENIVINEDDKAETFAFASGDGTITATFGVSALLPLDAPTLSAPTNITYNSVTLNWQELANAEGGYYVEIWLDDVRVVFESGIGETSWTPDFTFQANTTYTYTVQGVGDGSTYAEENNPKATSTFTTDDYPAATLTLSENGVETPVNGKLNTPIELPTTSTQACDGKVFMGWSATEIDGETDVEPSLLGETYTFTDPEQLTKTIYAVYAKEQKGSTSWNKVPTDYTDWVGNEFMIVYESSSTNGYVMKQEDVTNNYVEATIASGVIASKPNDAMSVIIEKFGTTDNYQIKVAGANPASYLKGKSDNGLSFDANAQQTTISYDNTNGWLISNNSSWLRYNTTSGQTRFRFYKSTTYTQSSYKTVQFYKKTAGESSYSKYCTTCEAAVAAPIFSLEEGNYDEAKTLELTATEGDIYYTINGGAETLYEEAIALNNRGTYEISAYAKVNDRTSDVVTKTYTLDWPYTSLAELAAADIPSGTEVTISFENAVIKSLATGYSIKGVYFDVQKEGKDIEIYCNSTAIPENWKVGGTLSVTNLTCAWVRYPATGNLTCWELTPSNWNSFTYNDPVHITSIAISGEPNKKDYSAGQQLNPAGLVVTATYSDSPEHTEVLTEGLTWTLPTLAEGATTAKVTVKYTEPILSTPLTSEEYEVTINAVTPAKTLQSIYIAEDSEHKDAFFVGRPFSAEGLKVMAKYNIGEDQAIVPTSVTPPAMTSEGTKQVTVSYTEGEVTADAVTYDITLTYMNLSDLVAATDINDHDHVYVKFENVMITDFYSTKGIYLNVQKGDKDIEIYNQSTNYPNTWAKYGTVSATLDNVEWTYYTNGSVWELKISDWDDVEYTAPSIYPTAVALSETSATVKQSKSLDLDAIFTPTNATILNNLTWSSDNTQVTVTPSTNKKSATVTVASDATVGTATITVKVDDKDGNELSATCVITIEEYTAPHYGLYYGELIEGDYLITYNSNGLGAMNTTITSNRAGITSVTPTNNIITSEDDAIVWHIAKSGDNWTLYNAEANKYAAGNGTNNQIALVDAATADAAKWTVTRNEEEDTYEFVNVGNKASSKNANLRRNTGFGFACYASNLANSGALTLYKAGFTPAAALTSIEIKGTLDITEYFQGKSVKYDGLTVEGTYSDASKKTITEGIEWSASPASFSDLGAQTVTITAIVTTKSGDVTDDAEFNVTVVESQQVNYGLVTNVNTLYDGATIILGAVFGTDATPIYAVNQGFDTKYLAAYRSNIEGSDLEYADEVMKTAFASEITLKKAEGGWKLMDENNKYIISNNADIALADNAEEATVWTISIEDGVAEIASGSNIIYYNTSSPRFKTYTNAQQEIGIYMKNLLPVRIGLTAGKIGTICYPKAIAAVDGANLYQPNYKDDAVKNIYFSTPDEYSAGLPMIFQADREIMKVLFTGEAVAEPIAKEDARGMVGNLTDSEQPIDPGMYIFTQNKLWITGVGCIVDPNRAYVDLDYVPYSNNQLSLDMPSGAPRRTICLGNGSASTPTGVNNLREGDAVNTAQKFFINGNIVIKNQGQLYNAQGNKLK